MTREIFGALLFVTFLVLAAVALFAPRVDEENDELVVRSTSAIAIVAIALLVGLAR